MNAELPTDYHQSNNMPSNPDSKTAPMNAPRYEAAKLFQKLGGSTVGVKEAAVLFAIVGDTSYPEICDTLNITNRTAWSRIAVLKAKGLVQTRHYPLGGIYHILTKEGRKIIGKTLDIPL